MIRAKDDPDCLDPFDLARFVAAQAGSYAQALSEIGAGRKRSHWMWYVFPQVEGLGHSGVARRYSVKSREEARAYLEHPVLGRRLLECAEAVVRVQGRTATEIFGFPDDLKLRSCATLFAAVAPESGVFKRILDKYYEGAPDERTLQILETWRSREGRSDPETR